MPSSRRRRRSQTPALAAVVCAVVCALIAATACGTKNLSFLTDDRLTIDAPRDRSQVREPVRVSWRVVRFTVTGRNGVAMPDGGYFGVFVDREPVGPGEPLESIASDDRTCRVVPGCPDERYLASRNVFSTTSTRFEIERLPDFTLGDRRDFHEVTIVLLDGTGRRIGESAFSVEFQVRRGRR